MSLKLNQLLANYKIHFRKLIQFHWHANANQVPKLQAQLERYYIDAEKRIDQVTDVIINIGAIPLGSHSSCLRQATIATSMQTTSTPNMVNILKTDQQVLHQQVQELESHNQNLNALKKLCSQLKVGFNKRIDELKQYQLPLTKVS